MVEIKDSEFTEKVLNSNKLVVVDFAAEWCGPCKRLAPVLQSISEKFEDVDFYKVDVDEAAEAVSKYSIRNVPTLIFYKNGEIVDKFSGSVIPQVIEDKIKQLN